MTPRLIINTEAPNKDGLLHSFYSKRPGPQSLSLYAGEQSLQTFFVRPLAMPLPFWETDTSLEALYLIASVAVGYAPPFAVSGPFAATTLPGFTGFTTTLTFNDLVLPHFEASGNQVFPATLSVRHESSDEMNVLLSWPVNISPYLTAPGGGATPLPGWSDGFYTREQVDAAIAARSVAYNAGLRGLVGGTASDLDAVPTATLSTGHLLFVVLTEGICGYRLEETTDAANPPWIVRGLDFDAGSNARAWVRQL